MIDSQGRLEIPLYHGTSSFFINSIEEHGLGGQRDPELFDLRILVLLADSLSKPENKTEWWEGNSYILEKMVSQDITRAGFNFRYGATYLTPSKYTAARYAQNKMGSEFLTTIHHAFITLESIDPIAAEEIIPHAHKLRNIFQYNHQPVLITATGVSAKALKTEQGEEIHDQLKVMEDFRKNVPTVDPEVIWQQFNFELCGTLDSKSIQFAEFSQA